MCMRDFSNIMNRKLTIICLIFLVPLANGLSLKKILEIIRRRSLGDNRILSIPRYPEDLPPAEPILPGHTLIQPALGMLKSAVKFPLSDAGDTSVYGNINNLGITYGNTNERILYTDFRKANNLLSEMIRNLQAVNNKKRRSKRIKTTPKILVVRDLNKASLEESNERYSQKMNEIEDQENDASEILDNPSDGDVFDTHFRRKTNTYRHRDMYSSDESDTEESVSDSSDYERNPGNPYTVHKDKYKQNWLWNHKMDGDHMNISPYGPTFSNGGPTGADLFFGRKWWYFNQDDFIPLG